MEADDELSDKDVINRGKALTMVDPCRVFQELQASQGDQKINLLEFNGEGVSLDQLLHVESVFDYKHFKDPKCIELIETKKRKGNAKFKR